MKKIVVMGLLGLAVLGCDNKESSSSTTTTIVPNCSKVEPSFSGELTTVEAMPANETYRLTNLVLAYDSRQIGNAALSASVSGGEMKGQNTGCLSSATPDSSISIPVLDPGLILPYEFRGGSGEFTSQLMKIELKEQAPMNTSFGKKGLEISFAKVLENLKRSGAKVVLNRVSPHAVKLYVEQTNPNRQSIYKMMATYEL